MSNKMLIDASHPEETRVAVVRGNRIEEYDFESQEKKQLKGNIYLAKVMRVEPSLQAAFVDYGGNRHGFLAFSEIHPDYYQIPMADRQALLEDEARQARAAREEEEAADDNNSAQAFPENEEDEAEEDDKAAKPKGRSRRRNSSRRSRKAKEETSEAGEENETNPDDDRKPDADTVSEDDADVDEDGGNTRTMAAIVEIDEISEPLPDGEEEETDNSSTQDEVEEKPKRRRTSRAKKADTQESSEDETTETKPKRTRRKKVEASEETVEVGEEEAKPKRRRTSRTKKETEEDETPDSVETAQQDDAASEEEEKPKRRIRRTSRAKSKDAEPVQDEAEEAESEDGKEESSKPKRRRTRAKAPSKSDDTGEQSDTDSKEDVESVGQEDAMEEVPPPRRSRRQYKIQEVIKRRQILLVQVVKEERGTKGAALTTYLSLAGRYSVLMPNTARGGGISRKITNSSDRSRLKAIANGLEVPDGMGVILRTAGASRTKADIERDFDYLMRLWEKVRNLTLSSSAPCLVYEEGSLIKRSIRDLYDREMGEVVVSGDEGYKEARDFMAMLMPNHAKKVKQFKDDRQSLFTRFGVETHLEKMLLPQVTLKSGGYLVINQTEALVAVDVNSGRSTREHSIEETALQTNLEAAEEVARQLRLRDLAGLIVIDFIDMEEKRNNRAVEKKLKDCLKHDRARIQVGRISHFGLLEMSRQRMRASVLESTMDVCPTCGGTGYIRSASAIALHILRSIEEHVAKHNRNDCNVKTTGAVAMHVLNHKRAALAEIEDRLGLKILIETDHHLDGQTFKIEKGDQATGEARQTAAVSPQGFSNAQDDDDIELIEADGDKTEISDEDEEENGRKRRRRGKRGGRRRGRRDQEEGLEAKSEEDNPEQIAKDEAATEHEAKEQDAAEPENKSTRRNTRRKRGDADGEVKVEEPHSSKANDIPAKADNGEDETVDQPDSTRRTTRRGKGTTAPAPKREPVDSAAASGKAEAEEQAPEPQRRAVRRTTRRKDNGSQDEQPLEASEEVKTPQALEEEPVQNQSKEEAKLEGKSKRKGWWSRGAGFFS